MGHRANYIVVEQGQTDIYYSQFGATSIPPDILAGPEATLAYARSLEPRAELLDRTYSEGAILIDLDEKTALFFENTGNHHFSQSPGLRRILQPFVEACWRGWSIRWAEHGWFDIAKAIGHPLETSAFARPLDATELQERIGVVSWMFGEPIDWREHRRAEGKLPCGYYDELIVTILAEDGSVLDYTVGATTPQLLRLGPAVIASFLAAQPVPVPNEVAVKAGVVLDLRNRAGSLWLGRPSDPSLLERSTASWDGWSFAWHHEGFPGQLARSGRDPGVVALRQSVAFEQLAEVFGFKAEDMPAAMRQRLRDLRAGGAKILHVDPTALDGGRVPDTRAIKQAILDQIGGQS